MYIISGDSETHWTIIKHLPARREDAEGEDSCPWCCSFLPNCFEIFLFEILNMPVPIIIQPCAVDF